LNQKSTQKIRELENELEIERDHAKNMDNFYRRNPPREDVALQNILSAISNDYLTINQENKQLKEQNQELKNKLELVEELLKKSELEPDQQLAAQIEISPKNY
jgi:7-keto-8-aminopelargonate synthetase-like enzyme